MENPSSPLDTLRQLKEMLDAGALTPTEFEALKQRLVLSPTEPASPDATAAAPTLPVPEAPTVNSTPTIPPASPSAFSSFDQSDLPPAPPEVDELIVEPRPEPLFMAEPLASSPVAVGGSGYVEEEALTNYNGADPANQPAGQNSSLGLVLAIAGVLVFLAVVAYLGFTRPASEHISSTSQTAADSVATAIETGPQVAPLPTMTAEPETVRVAPTNPAPVLPSRAELEQRAAVIRDSAEATAPPAAIDSTNRR